MPKARGRRPATRGKRDPGRICRKPVGVVEHQHLVRAWGRPSKRTAKHNHPVGGRIITGLRPLPRYWSRAAGGHFDPSRRAAEAVSAGKPPNLVGQTKGRGACRADTPKYDHLIGGWIEDACRMRGYFWQTRTGVRGRYSSSAAPAVSSLAGPGVSLGEAALGETAGAGAAAWV